MDDIPQDVLHATWESAQRDTPTDFLRTVANDYTDRADRLRALRNKSWQTKSREMDTVAAHLLSYTRQLEAFVANNPDGVSIVDDEPTDGREEDTRDTVNGETDQPVTPPAKGRKKKEAPQLPGNTGRCASFRRATPEDTALCTLERGHGGNHACAADGGEAVWPRRTSTGQVCGDVVVLPDGTALNCALPFGHGGAEHADGSYRVWPRGEGTSRHVSVCHKCNTDTHTCPGCGEPLNHATVACAACSAESVREIEEGVGGQTGLAEPPLTTEDELFPGQCADRNDDERCMLPGGHTGKHKGRKGGAWIQVHSIGDAPSGIMTTTLGDIAEQQRAAMVIPEQRAESDPAAAVTVLAPGAVIVAQLEKEVTATVDGFAGPTFLTAGGNVPQDASLIANPFAPPANGVAEQFLGHPAVSAPLGAPPVLGNPFVAPPPPPAAFLPPHMVPGEPKAHQSHSSITTMEKCGLQYRLKYRDGFGDDTPAWWNVAGTAFHTVVQAIESAYASGFELWQLGDAVPHMQQEREAAAMWKEQFSIHVDQVERESGKARSTWKAAKGGKEGEAFWREFGEDLCRSYAEHRRRFLAEPEGWRLLTKPEGGWAHEVEFNATVDGVLLKGFIDAAWISADGRTILIEDFKSGSSEGDPFQPKIYGAALRALGFVDGRRVITRFYEARKGAHSPTVDLTPDDDAEVSYRANTAQQMDRMGIFPANPSGYNCSTCPVKSRCPIMATKS